MQAENTTAPAAPPAEPRKAPARTGLVLALGALLVAAWAHREALLDPYVINSDARQHTYWMESFRDPELFREDPIAEYSRAYQPKLIVALYRGLAPLVAPLYLGKLLPLILLSLSAWLAYRVVGRLGGPFAGVLAGAWITVAPVFLTKMAGGHAAPSPSHCCWRSWTH